MKSKNAFIIFNLIWVFILLLLTGCFSQFDFGYKDPPTPAPSWQKTAGYADFPARYYPSVVEFQGKMWILGGNNGSVMNDVWSSPDGMSWTWENKDSTQLFTKRNAHTALVFKNKMWVIGGADSGVKNDVWCSEDGKKWEQTYPPIDIGSTPLWSGRDYHGSLVFKNKMWIFGGFNGSCLNDVWSSPDGTNWTETKGANFPVRCDFAYINKNDESIWIFGGYCNGTPMNDIWHSEDGVTWHQQVVVQTSWSGRWDQAAFYFHNKMWIMGGYDGSAPYLNDVWSSKDNGMTWELVSGIIPWTRRNLLGSYLLFDNKMWIIGGYNGSPLNEVWCSDDGATWKSVMPGWSERQLSEALSYNGKLWIIGGDSGSSPYKNDVWSTTDGKNWTEETDSASWTGRFGHRCVVFKGQNDQKELMWLIGGYDGSDKNDVYVSDNGKAWTQVPQTSPFPARRYFGCVVFKDQLWILGGDGSSSSTYLNDIWVSPDGSNWKQVVPESQMWSQRELFTAVVYDNKIWVLGGSGKGGTYFTDVWYTSASDGKNWIQDKDTIVAKRRGFSGVTYNNKLWIIGGYDGTTCYNDAWHFDGKTWTSASSCQWNGRSYHSSVVYDNKLWVISGYNKNDGDLRDVWYYSE